MMGKEILLRRALIIAICIFVMGACVAENANKDISLSTKRTALNSLIALAKEQASLDDGKRYWWRVFEKLDKISDDKLLACVSKKSDPTEMYRYVLEIGAGGAIQKLHWEKSDDFTKCIDRVLISVKLPMPPKSPFYFYLSEI